MRPVLLFFCLLPFFGFCQIDSTIYEVVEEEASFPGGEVEMMSFISQNIIYPEIVVDQSLQSMFYFSFVVEKDGSITNGK